MKIRYSGLAAAVLAISLSGCSAQNVRSALTSPPANTHFVRVESLDYSGAPHCNRAVPPVDGSTTMNVTILTVRLHKGLNYIDWSQVITPDTFSREQLISRLSRQGDVEFYFEETQTSPPSVLMIFPVLYQIGEVAAVDVQYDARRNVKTTEEKSADISYGVALDVQSCKLENNKMRIKLDVSDVLPPKITPFKAEEGVSVDLASIRTLTYSTQSDIAENQTMVLAGKKVTDGDSTYQRLFLITPVKI